MKITIISIIALILLGLPHSTEAQEVNRQFSKDLKQLKEYFHIPGIAALVEKDGQVVFEEYFGFADIQDSIEVTQNTAFPIASLTKIFAGVLLMKSMEEGKLSLETPINQFLKQSKLGDSVLVKHILTHTSQGDLGENFYYSYRFGALTPVIEKTFGETFKETISTQVLNPLGMGDSWFLSDSTAIRGHETRLAKPYVFDESTNLGPIEYGVSASSGIVSTAHDLLKFSQALDNHSLISEATQQFMFSAPKADLPYGHGIFTQYINGVQLIWGYGQYDSYSSLFLKIPDRKYTLILLANNNLMSDPARLIYGDVSSSLFALSFLKNYIFNTVSPPSPLLIRKQLLAQALASSFMSRFDDKEWKKSIELLQIVFDTYPNYLEYADLNLLHNLMFLKTVAFHREFGEFSRFDDKIESIGNKLLSQDPHNPYANVYLGDYYSSKGNNEKAKLHYKKIVDSKNFSPFWYTGIAKNWLKNNP